MGTVSGNWITGTHSGRACRHENLYTRVNKKTGKCYSAKLCYPNSDWTQKQLNQRANFGNVISAIASWVNTNSENSAANHADYVKVKAIFDRQTKYATLRGMIYGKGMYTIGTDGTVTVDITATTTSASDSGESTGGNSGTATKYTLTLVASPAAGGRVTGGGQFTAGSTVSVTATANSGYTFSGWSDGVTTVSRNVTVNSNQTLTANFTAGAGGDGDDAEA